MSLVMDLSVDDVDWSDWSDSDIEAPVHRSKLRRLGSSSETEDVDWSDWSDSQLQIGAPAHQAKLRRLESSPETENEQTILAEESAECEDFFHLNVSDEDLTKLTECSESDESSLSWMPAEVLELVFCQLPIKSLLNVGLVCHRFHQVVANEKFVYWKKRYHRYHKVALAKSEILATPSVKAVLASGGTILGLAREIASFKGSGCYSGINKALQSSTAFPVAYHILVKRLDNPAYTEGLNTWSLITLLVVMSESVREVEHAIKCLLYNASLGSSNVYCSVQCAVDCLYCVATHLLVLRDMKDLPPRLHYQLIAALWRHENLVSNCPVEQPQPLLKHSALDPFHHLTAEQLRIINHDMKECDVVKIVAYAGTGKTSTLVRYTQVHSDMKFLAVSYNKSVQVHARKIFPSNVVCYTMHSLAWKAVGWRYSRKLEANLRVANVVKNIPRSCNMVYAKLVMETLQNFIASADANVCAQHVPSHGASQADQCIRDAKILWSKMVDPKDVSFRITHDGYLKLYQLEKPTLGGYQCILVDEAQDCTAATADILMSQQCAKVFVGDPHQHVYGFRGAINVLEELEGTTHSYSLTQSFRFGPEIASVATALLAELKNVKTVINGCSLPSTICGSAVGQVAVIARTNLELFNKAIEVCLDESSMTRIAFVGGINGYGLDTIQDIYKLFSGNKRSINKSNFISRFASFAHLKSYVQNSADPEMTGKIKLVEQHHNQIPSRIAALKSRCYSDPDLAEMVFTTAHRAKGLEFETVRVMDDFVVSRNELNMTTSMTPEGYQCYFEVSSGPVPVDEKNLLYVAATRAKKALQMSRTLVNVLKKAGEQFLQVGPLPEVDEGVHFTCESCKQESVYSDESIVKVEQQQIILSTGRVFQARGLLCSNCSIKVAPCWKGLC